MEILEALAVIIALEVEVDEAAEALPSTSNGMLDAGGALLCSVATEST